MHSSIECSHLWCFILTVYIIKYGMDQLARGLMNFFLCAVTLKSNSYLTLSFTFIIYFTLITFKVNRLQLTFRSQSLLRPLVCSWPQILELFYLECNFHIIGEVENAIDVCVCMCLQGQEEVMDLLQAAPFQNMYPRPFIKEDQSAEIVMQQMDQQYAPLHLVTMVSKHGTPQQATNAKDSDLLTKERLCRALSMFEVVMVRIKAILLKDEEVCVCVLVCVCVCVCVCECVCDLPGNPPNRLCIKTERYFPDTLCGWGFPALAYVVVCLV